MNRFLALRTLVLVAIALGFAQELAKADDLQSLANDFWAWRAAEQPLSSDDIPRLDRPANWTPDWSPETVRRYQEKLVAFESRWMMKLSVPPLRLIEENEDALRASSQVSNCRADTIGTPRDFADATTASETSEAAVSVWALTV